MLTFIGNLLTITLTLTQCLNCRGKVGGLNSPSYFYAVPDLLSHTDACLDVIDSDMPSALVVIAGDFNSLSDDFVSRTALTSLVAMPTRGLNCLDRIYTNDACFKHVKIVKSAVKSRRQ